ncbi:MAG TPA: trehalase / alfa-L-rhamnosidase / mannosyl oligosaccharide glucosidase [Candidatus Blautia faecavium]|uniref:Trehalase / alfa-L-rhamnosidase / mannosyl oligosaccharide glucosidase n=1 Tax=Candidatus Blautia faecavium TaxID=2838487 RepID=A0A9D2LTC8_9FIRM|nr:trehalase / alfa-L-rhamnosidase / mannosyl oligosaccharide glucosidase [Candidatus Blautia faecavium]
MLEQKYLDYEKTIRKFVKDNVDNVLKEPREFIRYPFIDPGSVYDGNVWDWDTFWSVYGLLGMMEEFDPDTQERILTHAKGNVYNFFDHQLEDGYIPMMIEAFKWPEPYLNMKHKEGILMNMHKPFLCQQICLISNYIKDFSWMEEHYPKLLKYFECYDKNYYFENCGMYVWCDDIMIGMDNDPATFGRPKFSTANIFLNSFMVEEMRCMAEISKVFKKDETAAYFMDKRERLIQAVQAECWDKRDKFFYSADVDVKTRRFDWFHEGLGVFWKTLPIKIRVWSGFIPMFVGFATEEEAKCLVEHWKDESTFNSPYGITTLAKDEKMFDLSVTNNPSNWLGPIWLVANYVVFKGFLNYGFREEAEELCRRSLLLLGRDLEESGNLHEYYDPFTGKPIMNGGFINWNILAVNMAGDLNAENN